MNNFDNLYDRFYDNKKNIGIIFFGLSLVFLVYLLTHPINYHIIHGDERFTLSLIKLSLADACDLIVKDVHPPLYYFLLMGFNHLVGNPDVIVNIYTSKIVSIIPYALILIISAVKIKKDEGWFTAGLFTFAVIVMSGFFVSYGTLRMYSWSLLFSILTYLAFREILKNNVLKNWIIFSIFCILGGLTHYFTLFPAFIMYCILFLDIYLKNKSDRNTFKKELKNWIISVILSVILYVPWLTVLFTQVNRVHKDYTWSMGYIPNVADIINYISFCVVNDKNFTWDAMLLKFGTIILLVILILLFHKTYKSEGLSSALRKYDGIIIYLSTIVLGAIVLNLTYQPLIERYVIPAMGIFWISFAFLMGKLKDRKKFFILLVIFLLLSCGSFVKMENITQSTVKSSIHREELFNKLNNSDTVIIWPSNYRYSCYHNYVNKSIQYSRAQNKWTYVQDYKVEKNLSKIVEENPGKKVYILDEYYNNPKKKIKYPKDLNTTKQKGYDEFILLTKK